MKADWIDRICLGQQVTLHQGLRVLEEMHKEIVLVVDEEGRLLGTVTDGDLRRATLRGEGPDSPIERAMCSTPIVGREGMERREILGLMNRHNVLQLPIVDERGTVVDLKLMSEMLRLSIPLSDLCFEEGEVEAVSSVLRSGWLSMGDLTRQFEEAFADFVGVEHAIAVANGTAALHLAYLALGLSPGDEVICPSLSFVATANAILYVGAEPVFADIVGEEELTISPEEIERLASPRTRAVVVMHYGGYPCRMEEIARIANERGLYLIEDAAHAPGASLDGRLCGAWGDIGCFSFFANKNMTTGEGGMVTTNSEELAAKIRLMRSHGMTSLTLDRHRGRAYTYDVIGPGYNYRIDELRSAIGLVQLGRLPFGNERRRILTEAYWNGLAGNPDIGLPFRAVKGRSAFHIMPVLLAGGGQRQAVMNQLRERGIQTSIHYPAIHQFSFYRDRCAVSLPLTEAVASRQLTLPLYPAMEVGQVNQVVEVLEEVACEECVYN